MSLSPTLPIPSSFAETDSIKIGPEFFQNAIRDYSNKHWAFIREILQNSMDSEGCNRINITLFLIRDDNTTRIEVTDNGAGMTEDTLRNKLLTLGGSGKSFQDGKVGGFGKAKELLYFCHDRYFIRTQDREVQGRGAQFKVLVRDTPLRGCQSTVFWKGDHVDELTQQLRLFSQCAQWQGTLVVNGETLETNCRKGKHRRSLGFAEVYTSRQFRNRVIVRMHGIPMFVRYCGYEHTVVMELNGESASVLTSNRDYLTGEYGQRMQNFLTELTVDKRSALRNLDTSYTRFEGEKIRIAPMLTSFSSAPRVSPTAVDAVNRSAENAGQAPARELGIQEQVTSDDLLRATQIEVDFVIKNSTNPRLKTPGSFEPDTSLFSPYSRFVVSYWVHCLRELHKIYDLAKAFSVGFIFDEEIVGEYQSSEKDGAVFFINPAVIRKRRFVNRYKRSDKKKILAVAVHEFVHSLGYSQHDENYANRLTEVFADVLVHRKRFS